MNLIIAILVFLSGTSFSYRYTRLFVHKNQMCKGSVLLLWAYGIVLQMALFVNFLACDADIWATSLFIIATALATVHDIQLFHDISGNFMKDTASPILILIAIVAACVLLLRSNTHACTAGNGVIVSFSVIAGVLLLVWRYHSCKENIII